MDCMLTERQKFSKDGCERHMQVNHLAPALLTVLLLPSLARGAPSRVVMVNSIVSFLIPSVCSESSTRFQDIGFCFLQSSMLCKIDADFVVEGIKMDLNPAVGERSLSDLKC